MRHIFSTLLSICATLCFSSIIYCQSSCVFDANYFNNENAAPPIKIGKGFHINDPFRQTKGCFTTESSSASKLSPQQTGGKKTTLKLFYVKSSEDYAKFKRTGSSGQISFLNFFSFGDNELEQIVNNTSEEHEKIIFTVNVDFGLYSFDADPILTSEAKNLIESNKLVDFVKLFGTHYISGVRKESNISVILTNSKSTKTNGVSNSSNTEFGTKIPYKVSGSLEIENSEWINNQLNSHSYSVLIEINGPAIEKENIKNEISKVINSNVADKASAIGSIIESAVKNLNDPEQALFTQYYYTPFDLYGLDGIYWDGKKQKKLSEINEAVVSVYSTKVELESMIGESAEIEIRNALNENLQNNVPEDYSSLVMASYDKIIPKLLPLLEETKSRLNELENLYNNCSDIYCKDLNTCCNNNAYFTELSNSNINGRIASITEAWFMEFGAITKEYFKPECEKRQKGVITITNKSYNSYDLYADNKFIETIAGGATQIYYVDNGIYKFHAVQRSGYLIYPTENYRTAKISAVCDEVKLFVGFED